MRTQTLASGRPYHKPRRKSMAGPIVLGLLILGLLASYWFALQNSPTLVEPEPQEDSVGWECDEHGNGICGPLYGEADAEGIVVSNDEGPILFIEWTSVEGMEGR